MNPAPLRTGCTPTRAVRSLKLTLVMAFGTTFALCAAAMVLALGHFQTKGVAGILSEHAQAVASLIAALAHDQVAANDRIGLPARLESFNDMSLIRSLAITDRQRTPLAAVQRNAAGNMVAVPIDEIGGLGQPGIVGDHGLTPVDGGGHGVVWASIGKIAPIGWVRMEYETTQLSRIRKDWLNDKLVALTATTLLAFLLALKLAKIVSNALKPLMQAAGQLDATGPEAAMTDPVCEPAPKEFVAMIDSLNGAARLIAQLKAHWAHNQEHYRQMLFALPEPIAEIDAELRILRSNQAWDQRLIHGRANTDHPVDSIAMQLNDTELEHLTPGILALVQGNGEFLHAQLRISDAVDSTDAWFSLDAHRLLDPYGNFASLLLHLSPIKPPDSSGHTVPHI